MSKTNTPASGKVFNVPYPFTIQEENGDTVWVPKTRSASSDESGLHHVEEADGEGEMLLEVVSTFQPAPGYQTRVFYRRHFEDPDGNVKMSNVLKVNAIGRFNSLTRGYRTPYTVV